MAIYDLPDLFEFLHHGPLRRRRTHLGRRPWNPRHRWTAGPRRSRRRWTPRPWWPRRHWIHTGDPRVRLLLQLRSARRLGQGRCLRPHRAPLLRTGDRRRQQQKRSGSSASHPLSTRGGAWWWATARGGKQQQKGSGRGGRNEIGTMDCAEIGRAHV